MIHFLLMLAYAFLVSVFFSILWRHDFASQRRLFLQMFFGLVVGALLLAWLMYPFPSGPPGS